MNGGPFMLPEPIPPTLKNQLQEKNISQHRAAFALGISQGLLNQYLLGYRPFPGEFASKLAQLIEREVRNAD